MLQSASQFSLLDVLREQAPLLVSPSPAVLLHGLEALAGLPACVANERVPKQVRRTYRTFGRAGADVVLTNTGDAQLPHLEPHGLAERCEALNNSGRALLQEALGGSVIHAGHVRTLPSELPQQLREQAYGNHAVYLSDTKADLLWLTGFPNPSEAELAVRVIRRVSHTEMVLHVTAHSASSPDSLIALHNQGATYLGLRGNLNELSTLDLAEWVGELGILGLEIKAEAVPLQDFPDAQALLTAFIESGIAFLGGADLSLDDFRFLQGIVTSP